MQQDCNHCQELLWSFVAKELSDSETKKIQKHLQGCPSCRSQAEQLSQVISSLQEEIPLPATFSAELHQKLSLAAEEMATEKPSLGKRISQKLRDLSASRGFRTLAPALVCLTLVVGVFSTGLFDQWRDADRILTESPVSTPAPAETPNVTPDDPVSETPVSQPTTNPAVSTPQKAESGNVRTPEPAPATETPTTETDIPTPAMIEDIPTPASVGTEEIPARFTIPRKRPKVSCLMMADVKIFLSNWQEETGYEWESHVQDIPADEIVSGIDSTALVLELTPEAIDSLMDYANETEVLLENQGETLVVITGDEE